MSAGLNINILFDLVHLTNSNSVTNHPLLPTRICMIQILVMFLGWMLNMKFGTIICTSSLYIAYYLIQTSMWAGLVCQAKKPKNFVY